MFKVEDIDKQPAMQRSMLSVLWSYHPWHILQILQNRMNATVRKNPARYKHGENMYQRQITKKSQVTSSGIYSIYGVVCSKIVIDFHSISCVTCCSHAYSDLQLNIEKDAAL